MSDDTNTRTSHRAAAADACRQSYTHAREAAQEVVAGVKEQAADYYARGREKAKIAQESTEQYIRENPIKSVLIAAGAGILIGWLLKRR